MLAPSGTFVLYALGLLTLAAWGDARRRGWWIGLAFGLVWLAALPHGM
jgi:hypothetical protein